MNKAVCDNFSVVKKNGAPMKHDVGYLLFVVALSWFAVQPIYSETLSDTNLTATLESTRTDLSEQIQRLQQTITQLEERIDGISNRLGDHFERNFSRDTIEKRLEDLERKLERMERDLDDLDAGIRRMGSQR